MASEAAEFGGVTMQAERLSGSVRSFRGTWGFVTSEQWDGDLFVGLNANRHLVAGLRQGDLVDFEVGTNANGKPEAVNVEVTHSADVAEAFSAEPTAQKKPQGPIERAAVAHLVGVTMEGKIKSFRETWGFLVSDGFTGDLFIHRKSNPNLGDVVGVDDRLSFTIAEDAQKAGEFHAVDATPIKVPVTELLGQVMRGTVRKFQSGWGFLTSGRYEGDLFVGVRSNHHLEQFGLTPGETVEFEVGKDEKAMNGVQAIKVKRIQVGNSAMAGAQSFPGTLLSPICMGWVKSFKESWGFVNSPNYPGDIFIGCKENPHLQWEQPAVGDQVQFAVVMQTSGKLQAVNVQIVSRCAVIPASGGQARSRSPQGRVQQPKQSHAGPPSRDPASMVGLTVPGWVKSFKAGWGFVQSDAYNGDIFFGMKDNPHLIQEPSVNDQVHFKIHMGDNGKLKALDLNYPVA
eukprot:TRINITY_DN56474_c0_g1_i2.p1 TRINITY_DN56474_c0_g1~~TRINITY_DN56474_c0_g1_i2.p1  ORF type:complete len:476 (-),score=79.87 TRINITY_DN56474_c0_g1_i2:40-1410(-)